TVRLPVACALRMRVNMSAMGSVMLISFLPQHRYPGIAARCDDSEKFGLPTGLAQARNVAAHGCFAQLVTAETEFAVHASRRTGQRATLPLPCGARVARKLLQLDDRSGLFFVRGGRAGDDLLQLHALGTIPLDELGALDLAVDH